MTGTVDVRNRTYGLVVQIMWSRYGDYEDTEFFLALARGEGEVRSPTPRFGYQAHSYMASVPDSALRWRRSLGMAHVRTGSALGRWGSARLRFEASAPATSTCRGRSSDRQGTVTGSLTFTPRLDNGSLGTIHRVSFDEATLSTSTCHHRLRFGSGCPSQPLVVEGYTQPDEHSFLDFFASSFDDGSVWESVIYQQWDLRMSVLHEAFVTGPAVRLRDEGDAVRSSAAAPVAITGSAVAEQLDPDPYDTATGTCDDGRTIWAGAWEARLAGAPGDPMTARFDTGPVSLPAGGLDAAIVRIRVT